MSSPGKHEILEEKIIITKRERELLEIMARMINRVAPFIDPDVECYPKDTVLRRTYKAIEEFTSLQEEDISGSQSARE